MEEFLLSVGKILLQFNVMILIAELLFLYKCPRREHFVLRILIVPVYLVLFSSVLSDLLHIPFFAWYREFFKNLPYLDLQYAIIYVISVLIMWFCFDVSFKHVSYHCAMAYIVQNFTFHVRTIYRMIFFDDQSTAWEYNLSGAAIMIVIYLVAYFLINKRFRNKDEVPLDNGFVILFVTVVIVVIGVFDIVSRNLEAATWAVHIYAMIVCILLIMIQLGMFDKKKAIYEKEEIERLLASQAEQYSKQLANVDYINIKCHDLKHQIAVLKSENNAAEYNDYIGELERSIMIYENMVKTGNPVLDTLLTEKNLYCTKHDVRFSYIADGALLNGMESTDICALFGNAVDNAVEYMSNNIDKSRRILTMQLERHAGTGSMIRILFENTFDGKLELVDGLPKTTKKDERFHGYGLRSVRYIAEKYGGFMTSRAENGKFVLSVVMTLD